MDDFNVCGKPVLHVQRKHPLSSCPRKGKVALKCKAKGHLPVVEKARAKGGKGKKRQGKQRQGKQRQEPKVERRKGRNHCGP